MRSSPTLSVDDGAEGEPEAAMGLVAGRAIVADTRSRASTNIGKQQQLGKGPSHLYVVQQGHVVGLEPLHSSSEPRCLRLPLLPVRLLLQELRLRRLCLLRGSTQEPLEVARSPAQAGLHYQQLLPGLCELLLERILANMVLG